MISCRHHAQQTTVSLGWISVHALMGRYECCANARGGWTLMTICLDKTQRISWTSFSSTTIFAWNMIPLTGAAFCLPGWFGGSGKKEYLLLQQRRLLLDCTILNTLAHACLYVDSECWQPLFKFETGMSLLSMCGLRMLAATVKFETGITLLPHCL